MIVWEMEKISCAKNQSLGPKSAVGQGVMGGIYGGTNRRVPAGRNDSGYNHSFLSLSRFHHDKRICKLLAKLRTPIFPANPVFALFKLGKKYQLDVQIWHEIPKWNRDF